ncbi:MAG: large subunit ribosomal protein L23 [Cognaticolwellia sp.]|jgi:large subunit ribosomal protein L23|tara:strand:- start:194 stop:502 length:309 start_codon:yes stop_codon:yes gene_type:complete
MAKNVKKNILVKPLINEKSEIISDTLGKYTFIVDKKANKVEIRKAVEEMYGVDVQSVNTMIMPAKERSRFTKTGVMKGRTSVYKKAIITLEEGDEINFYGEV